MFSNTGTGDSLVYGDSATNCNDNYSNYFYEDETETSLEIYHKIREEIDREIELKELRLYWPVYLVLHNFKAQIIKRNTHRMFYRKISTENIGCRNFKKQG